MSIFALLANNFQLYELHVCLQALPVELFATHSRGTVRRLVIVPNLSDFCHHGRFFEQIYDQN